MIDRKILKSHMTPGELRVLAGFEQGLVEMSERMKVMQAQLLQVCTNLQALQSITIPEIPGPGDDARNFPKFDLEAHRRRIISAQEKCANQEKQLEALRGSQANAKNRIDGIYDSLAETYERAVRIAREQDMVASLREVQDQG